MENGGRAQRTYGRAPEDPSPATSEIVQITRTVASLAALATIHVPSGAHATVIAPGLIRGFCPSCMGRRMAEGAPPPRALRGVVDVDKMA